MVDKSMRLRVSLPEKDNMELGRHFHPNAPKSGIRVRRSPVSMVLLLKVAHGYTERQIGFNSTKLLKRWILVASF